MLKKVATAIWKNIPSSFRRKIVRTTQESFTVSVAAIIVNENGEVLLLDHVLRAGSGWGIPGGFLARGEQPVVALKRELYEETGIELTDVKLFHARTINRHIEILFRAKANGNAFAKSLEIKAVGWFKADELPKDMSRTQKELVEKLLKQSL